LFRLMSADQKQQRFYNIAAAMQGVRRQSSCGGSGISPKPIRPMGGVSRSGGALCPAPGYGVVGFLPSPHRAPLK
jgi:hypothetical protein